MTPNPAGREDVPVGLVRKRWVGNPPVCEYTLHVVQAGNGATRQLRFSWCVCPWGIHQSESDTTSPSSPTVLVSSRAKRGGGLRASRIPKELV